MSRETRTLSLKREKTPAADEPRLEERLHKVLAQAGLGSRRALEQRIADGMVQVNGDVAQTGMSVKSGDRIDIDGRSFVASALTEPARVLIYNKPEGEVTTREDPEGRPTIFEALPVLKGARWIAIGRLDINTTGLLLLTTDGELANAMMHPSFEIEREYVCRIRAPEGEEDVSEKIIDRLRRGVALEDGPAKFDAIERIGGTDSHDWFRVTLSEGRNREVRRLWESQGCQVSRLKRIRYGDVVLPQPLLRGQSQELPQAQVDALRSRLQLEEGPPPALTLQPVIGQRKAAKSTVHVGREGRSQAYVNGHNTADEGRELRRFDHVREDRGRFGNKKGGFGKGSGALTVSGEAAAKQAQGKPFKQRAQKGQMKPLPEGNPAAFRSWYVPEGVDTGPAGHRNAGPKAAKKPFGRKPAGGQGQGYAPQGQGQGYRGQGQGAQGEGAFGEKGAKGQGFLRKRQSKRQAQGGEGGQGFGGQGQGGQGYGGQGYAGAAGKPARPARPYGHPGNAPSFPSDHAGGGFANGFDRPKKPRPGGKPFGPKPAGAKPAGGKPFGAKPAGGKPGGRPGGKPAGGKPFGAKPQRRGPRGGGGGGFRGDR